MASDPIELCLQELPRLFARARAELQQLSDAGDKRAQARRKDADASRASARVLFEGDAGGELFVSLDRGVLAVGRQRPALQIHYALAVSVDLAQRALALFDAEAIDYEQALREAPVLGSARADQLFSMYKFGFELRLRQLPQLGDVSLRVGLGRDLPANPEFRIDVSYPELVSAREQDMGPQALFSSGKLVISGDVAKAMMLGMTLAQLR